MILPANITTTMLAHWIVENNMSRAQLADLLGLSKASIDRWMGVGTIPDYRKIRIAQTFNDYTALQKDHIRLNTPYGGVRTEASLYTANEWARLHKAAEVMEISTEEFQKRAVIWAMKNLQNSPPDPLPQENADSP